MVIPSHKKPKVLVVGDALLHRGWNGDVSRISPEAPVPVVHVKEISHREGACASIATKLCELGCMTTLLSVVGADEESLILKSLLDKPNINLNLVEDCSMKTSVAITVESRNQQIIALEFISAPSQEAQNAILNSLAGSIATHQYLILSDHTGLGELECKETLRLAKSNGKISVAIAHGKDYMRYHGANILITTIADLREITGEWINIAEMISMTVKLAGALSIQAIIILDEANEIHLITIDEIHSQHIEFSNPPIGSIESAYNISALLVRLISEGFTYSNAIKEIVHQSKKSQRK